MPRLVGLNKSSKGACLSEGAKRQAQQRQAIGLFARERLGQVHAEARQALQGGIDQIWLKGRGQTPNPQPLGNKEGIQAIGLARVGIDPFEPLDQGRIEHRETMLDQGRATGSLGESRPDATRRGLSLRGQCVAL